MSEPIKIDTRRDYQLPKRYTTAVRPIWWWPLLIPIGLMLFLAGLFIGAKIEEGSVVAPVQGISPEGHEGQTLVVETDGTTRWCEQTDPACHELGG